MSKKTNSIPLDTLRTVEVPEDVEVQIDPRTQTRNIGVPIVFPDGSNGIVIVCRVVDEPWPAKVKPTKITLNFQT